MGIITSDVAAHQNPLTLLFYRQGSAIFLQRLSYPPAPYIFVYHKVTDDTIISIKCYLRDQVKGKESDHHALLFINQVKMIFPVRK
ncbi:hypothetical protein D3C86_1966580 [compost metagenome]